MATAARLAMSAWRYEMCARTIRVVGMDLTNVDLGMQVRMAPDTPGLPLIDLAKVTTEGEEGLYLASAETVDGVPTSTIELVISDTTMTDAAKVPYVGELGRHSVLAYALQIGGQTRLWGDFIALANAYGSDAAPGQRTAGASLPANGPGPWGVATLTIAEDEAIEIVIDGAAVAGVFASQATQAAALAATYEMNTATYAASAQGLVNFRASLAAGISDFAVGEYFSSSETGELRVYERTDTDPFYEDMGDAAAPITKALMTAALNDKLPYIAKSADLAASNLPLDIDVRQFGTGDTAFSQAAEYASEIVTATPPVGENDTDWSSSTAKQLRIRFLIPPGYTNVGEGAVAIGSGAGVEFHGQGRNVSFLVNESDSYAYDCADNPLFFVAEKFSCIGGKGLAMFRDDTSYSRGFYKVSEVAMQGFTEAGIANLSSNFGRWLIEDCWFWAAGSDASDLLGIGLALKGMQDNSFFLRNMFHKCRYGMKLGNGGYSFTAMANSFMRGTALAARIQTDVWIVPDPSETNLGKAAKFIGNRFGGENLGLNDYRILVADETGSGNFAQNGHSEAASTHRVDGLIVRDNEAAGPSGRALIYSLIGRHKGWSVDNQLNGCPANIGYGADVTISSDGLLERSNVLGTVWAGLDKAVRSIALGAARRLWIIDDPIGLHVGEHLQDKGAGVRGPNWSYALDPNDGTAYVARGTGTTVSSASADFMGFDTKYTLTFAAANPSFGTSIRARKTFDVDADDVGEVCWIELWLEAADSHPLTQVNIGILPPSGGFAKKITATVPSAADPPIRIPWRPSVSGTHSLNIMPVDYVADEQDSVTVSRAAVYRNAEPIDTTDLTYKGWTLAQLPVSGVPFGTKAIVTDASSPTLGSVITGAGSAVVTATFDGTNWRS